MEDCWNQEPKKRISAEVIVQRMNTSTHSLQAPNMGSARYNEAAIGLDFETVPEKPPEPLFISIDLVPATIPSTILSEGS